MLLQVHDQKDISSDMCVEVLLTQLFCEQLKFQQLKLLDVLFHVGADRPSDCRYLRPELVEQCQSAIA